MKQQESNLFDKGMSLDTNPIAMDNHTLSGALNATMITMNGNELVLLNDMGNARVEYAYLPDGYVPVGMKEHGGIVYVASYNPIRGESLIGSFPSPERNISNDETGASPIIFAGLSFVTSNDTTREITVTTDKVLVLIPSLSNSDKKHIFRPGDLIKFSGLFDPSSDLYSVKAVIVDSDNNSIDVTDSLLPNGTPDGNFHYYDGKISGELFLVGKLKLEGDTIDVSITASDSENTRTVTVTPHLLDENGEIVNGATFKINDSYNVQSRNFTYSKDNNGLFTGTLEYEVYLLKPYGYIESISRKGSVDISKIGTGVVDFNYFYYYNNIQRKQIEFDYDINCYFSDTQYLSRCYLKLWEYNDLSNYFTVDLPLSSSFGSFSTLIPYGSGTTDGGESLPAIGKIYIGQLCVERGNSSELLDVTTLTCPKYFCIITSSVVNDYYMENASDSTKPFMTLLADTDSSAIEILVDHNIDWQTDTNNVRETITPIKYGGTPTVKDNSDKIVTGSNLESILNSFFGKQQVNNTTLNIKPKISIKYIDDSFPLKGKEDISFNLKANSFSDNYTQEISWETNVTDDLNSLGAKIDNITDTDTDNIGVDSGNVYPVDDHSNIVKLKQNPAVSDGQISLVYRSVLNSLFYGKLGEVETYATNDISAFVPFIDKSDYNSVSQLLGTDVVEKVSGGTTYYQPDSWFCFETWRGSKKARERKIMVMHAILWYDSISGNSSFNSVSLGEYSDDGSYGLFLTSSSNANWRFYTETLLNYVHESIRSYPTLIFWQGNNDDDSSIDFYPYNSSNRRTLNFCIPMMLSASGEMYVLNWLGNIGTQHILNLILDLYSKLYIMLDGLAAQFSYKKVNNFLYNNVYNINVNVALLIEINLKYTGYLDTSTPNPSVTIGGSTYYLPKFKLIDNTPSLTFNFSVTSPDISAEAEEYIGAEPTLSTCALIKQGENIIVKTLAEGDGGQMLPLDSSHVYWYDSTNDKFYDATEHDVTGCIASNFHKNKRYLVILKDADGNDNNVIYINKAKVGNILCKNTDNYVPTGIINSGDDKATKICDIAVRHIVKNLFNG